MLNRNTILNQTARLFSMGYYLRPVITQRRALFVMTTGKNVSALKLNQARLYRKRFNYMKHNKTISKTRSFNTRGATDTSMNCFSLFTFMSTTGMIRSYPRCLFVHIGRVKITCQPKIRHFSHHSLSKKNIPGSQISMHPLKYNRCVKVRYVRAPGEHSGEIMTGKCLSLRVFGSKKVCPRFV